MTQLSTGLDGETFNLEACPFCGSDNVDLIREMSRANYLKVQCGKCFTKGPVSVNVEYAVKWWNTRK